MLKRLLCCMLTMTIFGCSGEQSAPSPAPVQEKKVVPTPEKEQVKQEPGATDESKKAAPQQPPTPLPSRLDGFDSPSSVEYDPLLDRYLVANSGSHPWNQDGKGSISTIDRKTGKVNLKWIDGTQKHVTLNAPRDMAFNGQTLVVTDGAFIRFFDRKSGAHRGSFEVPGAHLLDGVAVALDETVYVTDSAWKPDWSPVPGSGVYMLNKGLAQPVLISEKLSHPGGLVIKDDILWTVSTKTSQLVALDRTGKIVETVQVDGFGLRGLAIDSDGDFLISSTRNGTLLKGTPKSGFSKHLQISGGSGGVGYDRKRNRIALPVVESGHVEFPTP